MLDEVFEILRTLIDPAKLSRLAAYVTDCFWIVDSSHVDVCTLFLFVLFARVVGGWEGGYRECHIERVSWMLLRDDGAKIADPAASTEREVLSK